MQYLYKPNVAPLVNIHIHVFDHYLLEMLESLD